MKETRGGGVAVEPPQAPARVCVRVCVLRAKGGVTMGRKRKIYVQDPDEKKSIIEGLIDKVGDGWVWCLHCERVYKPDEVRYDPLTDLFMCFYPDCNGDAVTDAFSYEIYGKGNHPEYPVIPQKGDDYSLY
jgi:hypothetical protein